MERHREKVKEADIYIYREREIEREIETQSLNHLSSISGFALPSMHHNNSPLLKVSYLRNFRHNLLRSYLLVWLCIICIIDMGVCPSLSLPLMCIYKIYVCIYYTCIDLYMYKYVYTCVYVDIYVCKCHVM